MRAQSPSGAHGAALHAMPGRKRKVSVDALERALSRPETSERAAADSLKCSRQALRTAAKLLLPRWLLEEVSIGDNHTACLASIGGLIAYLAKKRSWYAERLYEASEKGSRVLRLALTWDDTTSGNILRPNTGKKSCIMYCAVIECGSKDPADWFPVAVVSSAALKKKHGGMGPYLRAALQKYLNDKLESGFLVQLLDLFSVVKHTSQT